MKKLRDGINLCCKRVKSILLDGTIFGFWFLVFKGFFFEENGWKFVFLSPETGALVSVVLFFFVLWLLTTLFKFLFRIIMNACRRVRDDMLNRIADLVFEKFNKKP